MEKKNDDRIVTTTVGRLKAFEAAVQRWHDARVATLRAIDAREAADEEQARCQKEESEAMDAKIAATKVLHEELAS